MTSRFLLPAVLFLVCLMLRNIYERMKDAEKIRPDNKPVFIMIFISMCVLWMSWFILCPADPRPAGLPVFFRWLGLMIFLTGSILAVGALAQLRGVENIDHLVTAGLFRKLRHPMYTGFICWILGWSVYHDALISLAVGLPGIASILWWRHLEDGRLEEQFADSYRQYRRTTWF